METGDELPAALVSMFSTPPSSTFAYYDNHSVLSSPAAVCAVDPLELLWFGLVAKPPWAHVNTVLARLHGKSLAITKPDLVTRLRLDATVTPLLDALRVGPKTLPDLVRLLPENPNLAGLFVYALLLSKAVVAASVAPPPVIDQQPVARVSLKREVVQPTRPALESSAIPESRRDPRASNSPPKVDEERAQQIRDRAAAISKEDYFQMLGLAHDATTAQVQSAYLALAKQWHPDRLPGSLEGVRNQCTTVFKFLTDAHATLGADDKRAQYIQSLAGSGSPPDEADRVQAALDASNEFQKAVIFLKKNDLAQAASFVKKAMALDPEQADYMALDAWITAQKPENQSKERTLACIRVLTNALKIKEECERALFYRGMLYKRMGESRAAIADFRRSADLNPRNLESVREVRLHEMRAHDGQPNDGEKGILGKLFKR
jgi:tetratricopeptide (TPR) repeat protein